MTFRLLCALAVAVAASTAAIELEGVAVEGNETEPAAGTCSEDGGCDVLYDMDVLQNQYNQAPDTDDAHQITPDIEGQHADGIYHGEYDSDGAKQGRGVLLTQGGGKYVGPWLHDMRHGWGTQVSEEGAYVGDFVENQKQGMGTFTWGNGDKFWGAWKGGARAGLGILTLANGDKFMGRWSGDGRDGQGTFVPGHMAVDMAVDPQDGKNGPKRGQGICIYENGDEFVGEWYAFPKGTAAANAQEQAVADTEAEFKRRGERQSKTDGVCHWDQPVDGAAFTKPLWQGQGMYNWVNTGNKYVGEWKAQAGENHPDGQGSMEYADGSKYTGDFIKGTRHGEGIMSHASGKQAIGEWRDGEMLAVK